MYRYLFLNQVKKEAAMAGSDEKDIGRRDEWVGARPRANACVRTGPRPFHLGEPGRANAGALRAKRPGDRGLIAFEMCDPGFEHGEMVQVKHG